MQALVDKWQRKNYHMKHIQASQFLTSTGKLQISYHVVFTNLSLDESQLVFEVNSTELSKHYRNLRRHFVPTEITQVIRKNELLYSAIFTRSNAKTDKHLVFWNDSLDEHEKRVKKMKNRGYLLKAQSFTYDQGHYSISSIYVASVKEWFIEYNLTVSQSLSRNKEYRLAYVMTSISAYLLNDTTRFALVFEAINYPDYTLWSIWNRSAKFTREVVNNFTAPSDIYEATGIVGFQSYNEIRYILILGRRNYYYD